MEYPKCKKQPGNIRLGWRKRSGSCRSCAEHQLVLKGDTFDGRVSLRYHWGCIAVLAGKTDTYSVEGNNAELGHYLAWLVLPVAFQVVRMLFLGLFVYLSIPSLSVNLENTVF